MRYLAFEKSVGGVVYREQDGEISYLLLRYRSWQWDFPKGHVEEGETEDQTLRREIEEETGLNDIEVFPGFRMMVRYFYTAKGNEKKERVEQGRGIYIFKKVAFYLAKTKTSDIRIDFENKAFAWLDFEQAMARIGNDDSRKILHAANERIIQERM